MPSVHDKLKKVRKPRVQISYEVETEGGSIKKELPFVVGVMGDYSGNLKKQEKAYKDRKFTEVDSESFSSVMSKMEPGVKIKVENTLKGDGSEMPLELKFNSMEDFEPANIVAQVEPLKKLLDTRNKLNDLLSKVDRSEDLEELLEKILKNTEELQKVSDDLGIKQESDNNEEAQ